MKRSIDPERFRAWAENPTTEEVLGGARDALIAALERPAATPEQDMATDAGREHVLELVRRLKTVHLMRQTIVGARNMDAMLAELAKQQTADGEAEA
jgi:hypothetical protein